MDVVADLEDDRYAYRTAWNIGLSCAVTVLTCAWAAIHPNIRTLCDRIFATLLFIIFPEYILAWAITQYRVAKSIVAGTGLTENHGFFAIMGGYYFYNDLNRPTFPVDPKEVFSLASSGQIELPSTAEITDNSKSNSLMEVLLLLQAFWFVTQCIARATQSIHVSKMELLTIGYISMALCIYLAFWNKPRNVDQPVRIPHSLDTITDRDKHCVDEPYLEKLAGLIFGMGDDKFYSSNSKRIPPFWAGEPLDYYEIESLFTALLVGGVSAGINCIAWSYETSSLAELVLWRFSSLAGLGSFLLIMSGVVVAVALDHVGEVPLPTSLAEPLGCCLVVLCAALYVICRILSIVLAICEFSTSPSGVYDLIPWTEFIPHI